MKIKEWIAQSVSVLVKESGTARLDAEVLLSDSLGKDRAWVLAHPECELDEKTIKKLNLQIGRRAQHEPLAYIRGKVEFYGREFVVNNNVLVPRPESETMIELFKNLKLPKNPVVSDVGSGSGAIGITAALEVPGSALTFLDIDPKTIIVAKKNAKNYHINAEFLKSDLLGAIPKKFDALLCNLPYVPTSYKINSAAMTEPKIAIFGGADGLDLYRRLFSQLSSHVYGTPAVITESLPFQHSLLRNIASESGYVESKEDDFIQLFTHTAPHQS